MDVNKLSGLLEKLPDCKCAGHFNEPGMHYEFRSGKLMLICSTCTGERHALEYNDPKVPLEMRLSKILASLNVSDSLSRFAYFPSSCIAEIKAPMDGMLTVMLARKFEPMLAATNHLYTLDTVHGMMDVSRQTPLIPVAIRQHKALRVRKGQVLRKVIKLAHGQDTSKRRTVALRRALMMLHVGLSASFIKASIPALYWLMLNSPVSGTIEHIFVKDLAFVPNDKKSVAVVIRCEDDDEDLDGPIVFVTMPSFETAVFRVLVQLGKPVRCGAPLLIYIT